MISTRHVLIASALLAACGTTRGATDAGTAPDSASTSADSGGASTRGTISGTVSYAGTMTGRLTVGAWTSAPPMGPPSEYFVVDAPTFPVDYELAGLAAGTYYVGAMIDVGNDNPTIPGAEDPLSFPEDPIVIAGGETIDRDVVLSDPM